MHRTGGRESLSILVIFSRLTLIGLLMASQWPTPRDFVPVGKAPVPGCSIFKVPKHLAEIFPDMTRVNTLHLGLQGRSRDDSQSLIHRLKEAVASALHMKLLRCGGHFKDFCYAVVNPISTFKEKYEEVTKGMPDDAVMYTLALDALFLIVFFQFESGKKFNIPEFKDVADIWEPTFRSIDLTDFLLLENQIPMELLKRVMVELCRIAGAPVPTLDVCARTELNKVLQCAVLALIEFKEPAFSRRLYYRCKRQFGKVTYDDFFEEYMCDQYGTPDAYLENNKHLLDCVYHVVCGHVTLPYECDGKKLKNKFLGSIPSATELQNYGIKLQQSSESWNVTSFKVEHSLLHSAHLRLPKVVIYVNTRKEFRNFAIYEQLLGEHDVADYCGDFRCYLLFMDQLCRHPEDWKILSERGLVEMQAGGEYASDMWTQSMKGVTQPIPTDFRFTVCYNEIEKHCVSFWGPWRRRNVGIFCGEERWKWVSILAGLVLLLMTAFQTYFTVVNSATRKPIWPPSISRGANSSTGG